MQMKRPPHGFTLVELLMVITIIGMLVGLLLPAVNMAREAGRRATCSNNLHQLSAAVLGHAEKLNFFPSGGWGSNWVGNPDNGTGINQPGGWIYQVLPYMDGDALHELGKGGTLTVSTSASATRVSMPLPVLYCPSRRAGAAYPYTLSTLPNNTSKPLPLAGRTDYAINGGSVVPQGPAWPTFPHFPGPTSLPIPSSFVWPSLETTSSLTTFNGIATIRSQVTDAMITDTKDTTYLIGEKYLSPENYTTGLDYRSGQNPLNADGGDLYSAISGDDVGLTRWGTLSLVPSMDRPAKDNPPANPSLIFGSAHPAGWHAAFCDGHVQLIGWAIDPSTHQTMASRNGVRRLGYAVVDPSKISK